MTRPQPSTSSVEAVARVFMQRDDDCFQASIATLLGLPLSAVPRFDEEAIPGKNQNRMARSWLQSLGYVMEVWLADIRRTVEGFHIACGTSPRGRGHAVVYRGNDLFHDPHPEGGGLVGEIDQFIVIRPEHPALPSPEREPMREALDEARFLCERLCDFESELDSDEVASEFYGHVAPSLARLQAMLAPPPAPSGDRT